MLKSIASFIALATVTSNCYGFIVEPGPYAQLSAGPNWVNVDKNHNNNGLFTDWKDGYMLAASLGYRFERGYRIEEEVSFHHNSGSLDGTQSKNGKAGRAHNKGEKFGRAHASAHRQTAAGLINVLYDFQFMTDKLTPYFGAGIGYGWSSYRVGKTYVKIDNEKFKTKTHPRRYESRGFAWQIIAGALIPVSCKVDIGVEYRFFKVTNSMHENILAVTSRIMF